MGHKTKNVRRSELIANVAKRINSNKISQDLISDIYSIIMEHMFTKLQQSEYIWIPGFGVFYSLIARAPRIGLKKFYRFYPDLKLKKFLKTYFSNERKTV